MNNVNQLLGKLLASVILRKLDGLDLSVSLPDGNKVDLSRSYCSDNPVIDVLDWSVFVDMALGYDLGFAEAYLRNKWQCDDLPELFYKLAQNTNDQGLRSKGGIFPAKLYSRCVQKIRSANSMYWSRKNIGAHYDLGNEFFSNILDQNMNYSCAVFEPEGIDLAAAQDKKIDLLLSNSNLGKEDHILDIGCGWGRLLIKAVEDYGCMATGVTLSEKQYDYCVKLVHDLGLDTRVKILLQDYRTVRGQFDHIYSVEMLEAVGHAGLKEFFFQSNSLLKRFGTLGVQVITIPDERYESYRKNCDFIQKYIFPGGVLPSMDAIKNAASRCGGFVAENISSIGSHYKTTLMAWRNNLNSNSEKILKLGFSDRDIRRFDYYFSYCEGGFVSKHIDDHQICFRKTSNVV